MPMTEKRDYYEVLGVARDASDGDIKSSYRKLAMKYHPDRNAEAEAEERFKEASEAYSVLADAQKRAQYDRFGHAAFGGGGNGSGAGFDPSVFTDFSDIFGDIFGFGDLFGGGGRRGNRPQRGSDLRYDLEITFEESLKGVEKTLKFSRLEECGDCKGHGGRNGAQPSTCQACGGRGQVRFQQGFFSVARTCSACMGAGRVNRDPCPRCKGKGRAEQQVTRAVPVPAGVDDGNQLRISGEGEAGTLGGSRGDLFVVLHIKPDPIFERRDQDLFCSVPLSFPQAALGCDLVIPTPWGEEKVSVPAGIQSGAELPVLRGKGVPRVNGRGRGDLHMVAHVETPQKLTREQRQLFEQLRDLMPHNNQPRDRGLLDKVKDFFA